MASKKFQSLNEPSESLRQDFTSMPTSPNGATLPMAIPMAMAIPITTPNNSTRRRTRPNRLNSVMRNPYLDNLEQKVKRYQPAKIGKIGRKSRRDRDRSRDRGRSEVPRTGKGVGRAIDIKNQSYYLGFTGHSSKTPK